jgi:hypothetical protein
MTIRPLHSALEALEAGARSIDDVSARTGLSPDVVSAAIDHLVRLGRLSVETLAFGCPGGGCGTCASGAGDTPGCGAVGPSNRRQGPVLVTIRTR